MVDAALTEIETFVNGTDVKKMKQFRTKLFHDRNVQSVYGSWMRENADDLIAAKNIEKVFVILSQLWSFLDFKLLKFIIDFDFISEDLQEYMNVYSERFSHTAETAKVKQLAHAFECYSTHHSNSHNVTIGVDQNISDWTIAHMMVLKEDLCKETMVFDCAMTVACVKEGSIWITWHVSELTASQLQSAVPRYSGSFFKEYRVLKLEVDGVTLYKPDSPG